MSQSRNNGDYLNKNLNNRQVRRHMPIQQLMQQSIRSPPPPPSPPYSYFNNSVTSRKPTGFVSFDQTNLLQPSWANNQSVFIPAAPYENATHIPPPVFYQRQQHQPLQQQQQPNFRRMATFSNPPMNYVIRKCDAASQVMSETLISKYDELQKELKKLKRSLILKELEKEKILNEVYEMKKLICGSPLLADDRCDGGKSLVRRSIIEGNDDDDENCDTDWLNCLKESLSSVGKGLVVRHVDQLHATDSVEAVLLIKRTQKNKRKD